LRLVISWFVNAVALAVAVWLLDGIDVTGESAWLTLALVAVIFGLVNALIRPLVKLLTCLINVITLGLFTLVINAAMLWFSSWIAQQLELGFVVEDFWWAFLGALIISVVSFVLNVVFGKDRDKQ
jgi:putative membrane protein